MFLEILQNSQEKSVPESLFNTVAGLRPAAILQKTLARVFSCEFCEVSMKTIFTEHLLATASTLSRVNIFTNLTNQFC